MTPKIHNPYKHNRDGSLDGINILREAIWNRLSYYSVNYFSTVFLSHLHKLPCEKFSFIFFISIKWLINRPSRTSLRKIVIFEFLNQLLRKIKKISINLIILSQTEKNLFKNSRIQLTQSLLAHTICTAQQLHRLSSIEQQTAHSVHLKYLDF